jgi:hypothetical protein
MNLSEDLIRCISKYNPNFAFVNKEFNQYYKKINNAAKVIQKQFKLYRAKSLFGKCRFCGNYHYNEFYNDDSLLYMYNYWYRDQIEDTIEINQTSQFDRTIMINFNYDNIINKEKTKSKKYKKNKYISKKQERKKLKRNFKYSNKIKRKNIKRNRLCR